MFNATGVRDLSADGSVNSPPRSNINFRCFQLCVFTVHRYKLN